MAGLLATVFRDDVVDSFPVAYLVHGLGIRFGDWNWPALWFWVFVVGFSALWAFREAIAASDRRAELANLTDLVENTAPPQFLERFETLYTISESLSAQVQGKPEYKDSDLELMRSVIDAMISLAALWDINTSDNNDVYRGNIMRDLGAGPWEDEVINHSNRIYGDQDWADVRGKANGALYVDKNYSTVDQNEGQPDPDVQPLALFYSSPARTAEGEDSRAINLDGAPQAIVDQQMSYVFDTAGIQFRDLSDLSATIHQRIADYYAKDSKAKSVIAMPIPGPQGYLGVVNLYRNSVGIMGSRERAEKFGRLMSPFRHILGNMLAKMR